MPPVSDGSVLVAYVHPATQVEHSFTTSLMGLVNFDAAHNQRLFRSAGPLMMRSGTGGLVDARNKIMAHFLDEAEEEWLWIVDTDMGFLPDTVDRLVDVADQAERPVVGALCFSLRQGDPDGFGGYATWPVPTIYGWHQDAHGHGFRAVSDYPRNELVRVAGTGAACLLVHRAVAGKVRAGHGDDWFTPVRYPDRRFVSEDLSFCYRLGALGIPVHVHTGIKTTHAKQIWVSERDFLAHQALSEAVARVTSQVDRSDEDTH